MKRYAIALILAILLLYDPVYLSGNENLQVQETSGSDDIPEYIMQMIEKYPETEVLIEYYNEIINDTGYFSKEIDISEDISTDDVPLFLQWDKRWAFLKYGSETVMATSGCGPACLSMALCYYKKGTPMSPKAVADFSYLNNYYAEFEGTYATLFTEGAASLGLIGVSFEMDMERMYQYLDEGKLIIALMGYGTFTYSGHYILIKGYDENGCFLVNDPNSLIKSLRGWDADTIINEAKQMWALWI